MFVQSEWPSATSMRTPLKENCKKKPMKNAVLVEEINAFNPTNSCVRDNNHDSGKISVYFMYMTCREYADSGFSQSAEFHIRLWTGEPNGDLLPSPICFCARHLNLSSGGREGASLVESAFPLSCLFIYLFLLPSSLSPFLTMNLLVL